LVNEMRDIYGALDTVFERFAVDCAERVVPILEQKQENPAARRAILAARDWLRLTTQETLDAAAAAYEEAIRQTLSARGGVGPAWIGTRGKGTVWTDARARWKAIEARARAFETILLRNTIDSVIEVIHEEERSSWGQGRRWQKKGGGIRECAEAAAQAAAEAVAATTPEREGTSITRTRGWYSEREWQYSHLLSLLREENLDSEIEKHRWRRYSLLAVTPLASLEYHYSAREEAPN